MQIVPLSPGESAPERADFIRLDLLPSGVVNLSGVLPSMGGSATTGEIRATLGTTSFDSVDAAEAEGFAWARDWGAETLFVVTADAS